MSRSRKKGYSKYIVALIIFLNVLYAGVGLMINYSGYDVSPTLTTCWFAFTGTEIAAMAGIKVAKIKHEVIDEDGDTDNREGEKGPKDGTDDDIFDEEDGVGE